jgi:hypothetical protein
MLTAAKHAVSTNRMINESTSALGATKANVQPSPLFSTVCGPCVSWRLAVACRQRFSRCAAPVG